VFVWWVPVTAFLLGFLPKFAMLLRALDKDDLAPIERQDILEAEFAILRSQVDALTGSLSGASSGSASQGT